MQPQNDSSFGMPLQSRTIIFNGTLTEREFHQALVILLRPLERYKYWVQRYVFDLVIDSVAELLITFLRQVPGKQSIEIELAYREE